MGWLYELMSTGKLKETLSPMLVDDPIALVNDLDKTPKDEREDYLKIKWPGVYVCMLKAMGRDDERREFMNQCKRHRMTVNNFTLYTLGYLNPWLESLNEDGKLVSGKC